MRHSTSNFCRFTLAALLPVLLCRGAAEAQIATDPTITSDARIEEWVADLAAPAFKTRQTASAELSKAGAAAIEPLRLAMKTATLERKARIEQILKQLEGASFENRLALLKTQPTAAAAAVFPVWGRFAKMVGDDAESVRFFTQLVEAEPGLFAVAMNSPRMLRSELQKRSAELLLSVRAAARTNSKISAEACGAQMLLASDPELLLQGKTSEDITTLLRTPGFVSALQGKDGPRYLKLAGAYIVKKRIDVVEPLKFARRHPLPEGPDLARRTLKTALRGHNGLWSMIVLLEQGTEADIVLLESLLSNRTVLHPLGKNAANDYVVFNGDMALAVAIAMRKQDPREFGFGKHEPRDGEFPFDLDTVGFHSEEERRAAREKYEALFLAKSPTTAPQPAESK